MESKSKVKKEIIIDFIVPTWCRNEGVEGNLCICIF